MFRPEIEIPDGPFSPYDLMRRDELRAACMKARIQWNCTGTNGKPLTVSQMKEVLKEKAPLPLLQKP